MKPNKSLPAWVRILIEVVLALLIVAMLLAPREIRIDAQTREVNESGLLGSRRSARIDDFERVEVRAVPAVARGGREIVPAGQMAHGAILDGEAPVVFVVQWGKQEVLDFGRRLAEFTDLPYRYTESDDGTVQRAGQSYDGAFAFDVDESSFTFRSPGGFRRVLMWLFILMFAVGLAAMLVYEIRAWRASRSA